jgi:hypothetical protein
MALQSTNSTVVPIPVIIYGDDGALIKVIYVDMQDVDQPLLTGREVMLEIRTHILESRISRFAKRCTLNHQTVSVSKLISVSSSLSGTLIVTCPLTSLQISQGPHLSPPIYNILLTRALKKPIRLRNIGSTDVLHPEEVLVIEWQPNQEARAMAAKLARIAVRAGVVAFSILNLVGV